MELLVAAFDSAVDLTLCIALGSVRALVVEFFTLAQTDLHLDLGVLEINCKRDQ